VQVTEHIHAIKIPFKLSVGLGRTVDRFVYAYLIYGEQVVLIDSGVASSDVLVFDYLRETGRDPHEISVLVLTHSHPDHIGGTPAVKRKTGCRVGAHIDAQPWIEDVKRQFRERPIVDFHSLVEGSVDVDLVLNDGDSLALGKGLSLRVLQTAGHSKGSVSLLFDQDGALFSGDAIPMAGQLPIYEDVLSSIRSIRKLKEVKGLEILFSSWSDPQRGDRVYELMDEGLVYFQQIHEAVRKVAADSPSLTPEELCAQILRSLGLPENAVIPIVVKSIEAHMRVIQYQDLLRV
jgi:glyoxylase-like metal-dependent hydrolase (beta-lactamase superfamily II)